MSQGVPNANTSSASATVRTAASAANASPKATATSSVAAARIATATKPSAVSSVLRSGISAQSELERKMHTMSLPDDAPARNGAKSGSSAARKLLKAQHDELGHILADLKAAGPEKWVKRGHWAWYVWPTTKPGMSDPRGTAVQGTSDVAFVLASKPTLRAWTDILAQLARTLAARRSKRCIPSIDHGRIEFFLQEWGSRGYAEAIEREGATEFAEALQAFAKAWKAAAN